MRDKVRHQLQSVLVMSRQVQVVMMRLNRCTFAVFLEHGGLRCLNKVRCSLGARRRRAASGWEQWLPPSAMNACPIIAVIAVMLRFY